MSIIFAILLFSILIFVHELGHFLAAKGFGVQVNEFSMFMGPAIFKKKVGDTLYAIRCIPIGGYCAMEGEEEDTDSPASFQKAAWWKRLIILLAGSAMNFIAGLLIMALVFIPAKQFVVPVIDDIEQGSSLAGESGLREGDLLLELDGEKILVQSDFSMLLAVNPADTHDILVSRNGEEVLLEDVLFEARIFGNEETPRYGITFGGKLKMAWYTSLDTVRSVWISLEMLLTGKAGINDLTGPVGIVNMMSETAAASETAMDAFLNMLYFGGFIAINLSVMNLLPIPALDGGRTVSLLLTTAIEAITKKKINPKVEMYIHGAGMIILLLFMGFVLFKDIFVIFKG